MQFTLYIEGRNLYLKTSFGNGQAMENMILNRNRQSLHDKTNKHTLEPLMIKLLALVEHLSTCPVYSFYSSTECDLPSHLFSTSDP